jgi:hypothetical protein
METGEASGWLAPIAELDSDVSFKMNFHKNAIHDLRRYQQCTSMCHTRKTEDAART